MPQIGFLSEADVNAHGGAVFLAVRHHDLFGQVLVNLGIEFPCAQANKFPKIDDHYQNYESRVKRGNESLCRLVVFHFEADFVE